MSDFKVSCHCGDFHASFAQLPATATSCNCGYCTKHGVLWGYFAPDDVKIAKGEHDKEYAPSGVNHHHFCSQCGCSTWSLTPDWGATGEGAAEPPMRISINLNLLDGTDPRELAIENVDGRSAW